MCTAIQPCPVHHAPKAAKDPQQVHSAAVVLVVVVVLMAVDVVVVVVAVLLESKVVVKEKKELHSHFLEYLEQEDDQADLQFSTVGHI